MFTERKEEKFHDQWANDVHFSEILVHEAFESCTAPENSYIVNILGDVTKKRILDLGAGMGESAVYFASKGAIVTAADISSGMLNVAQQLANHHDVAIETVKTTSNKLPFPDESFDVIYAANMLHHVDMPSTLREIKRILKKSGIFVSYDPLAHNPIINMYRNIAQEVRTPDEQPLSINDIAVFKEVFPDVQHKTFWFTTLLLFMKYYLVDGINPNKERYWKRIIKDHNKLERQYSFLKKMDDTILNVVPFFRRYCWNIVFICKKVKK